MSNDNGSTVLPGGTIRVQFGVDGAPANEGNGDTLRSGVSDGSAISMDREGNVKTFGGVSKYVATHEVDPSQGVLASARSQGGSRSAPINDATLVDLPGFGATTVANAIVQGFLRRDGPGRYVETGKTAAQFVAEVGQPATSAAPSTGAVPLLPQTEAAIEAIASSVPFQLRDSVHQHIAVYGADSAIAKFAGQTTMDPETFAESLRHVEQSFAAHAGHTLAKLDIDPQQFAEWATANAPQEFKSAKLQHAFSRDAGAYAALADKFLRRTAAAPAADTKTRINPATQKQEVYVLSMGWITLAAARHAGLVQ
jgi:hypothetical protein